MSLFELFVIGALATYRLTFMLNSENGPGDIFARFRTRIGVRFDEYSKSYGTNWFAEGVLCFFCLSVWMGFAVTLWLAVTALLGFVYVGAIVLFPFAMSGIAVYMKKAVG